MTHWSRVRHMYVGKLTIIGSDNGLLPMRRHAIIWTNAGLLPIGTLGEQTSAKLTHFIQENVYENVVCERASILTGFQCFEYNIMRCLVVDITSMTGGLGNISVRTVHELTKLNWSDNSSRYSTEMIPNKGSNQFRLKLAVSNCKWLRYT